MRPFARDLYARIIVADFAIPEKNASTSHHDSPFRAPAQSHIVMRRLALALSMESTELESITAPHA